MVLNNTMKAFTLKHYSITEQLELAEVPKPSIKENEVLVEIYSASKAALHSYTQYLRLALNKETNVKVFELMPPLVDTEFSAPIGGKNGVSPAFVAEQFVAGLENDTFEIRVGQTEDMYRLYLSSPEEALKVMNQSRTEEIVS